MRSALVDLGQILSLTAGKKLPTSSAAARESGGYYFSNYLPTTTTIVSESYLRHRKQFHRCTTSIGTRSDSSEGHNNVLSEREVQIYEVALRVHATAKHITPCVLKPPQFTSPAISGQIFFSNDSNLRSYKAFHLYQPPKQPKSLQLLKLT